MTDLGVTTRKSSSKGHLTTSNTNDEVNHYFMTAIIKGIKERHGVKACNVFIYSNVIRLSLFIKIHTCILKGKNFKNMYAYLFYIKFLTTIF